MHIYSYCHGNGTDLNLKKKKMLPFLVTEGPRVLEKMVSESQVPKTVFGHLNQINKIVSYTFTNVTRW